MEAFLCSFYASIEQNCLELSDSSDYLNDNLEYLDLLFQTNRELCERITHIKYANNPAKSLEWLKYFSNVQILDCSYNLLTSTSWAKYVPLLSNLDISGNYPCDLSGLKVLSDLTHFRCIDVKIGPILDISCNPKIQVLNCSLNSIRQIIGINPKTILSIDCDFNQISLLDLSRFLLLVRLSCSVNKLKKLNFNGLKHLKFVKCDNNKITKIIGLKGLSLLTLICHTNRLKWLNLSGCIYLIEIDCDYNELILIAGTETLKSLEKLSCAYNKLHTLNLTQCTLLKRVNATENLELNETAIKICKYLHLKNFLNDFGHYFQLCVNNDIDLCSICLNSFDLSNPNHSNHSNHLDDIDSLKIQKISTQCCHAFHMHCISEWFYYKNYTCPHCRRGLINFFLI